MPTGCMTSIPLLTSHATGSTLLDCLPTDAASSRERHQSQPVGAVRSECPATTESGT
jgi:hypothetical protein